MFPASQPRGLSVMLSGGKTPQVVGTHVSHAMLPEEVAAAHGDGPGDFGGQALADAGHCLMHRTFQDKESRTAGAVLLVVRAHPFPPG